MSQYTAEELAKADASVKWKDKGLPENLLNSPIPTLKSVLSTGQIRGFIDIKSPDADPATMGNALLNVLKETNSLNRVRVYSTEDRYMEALPVEIPALSRAAKPARVWPRFPEPRMSASFTKMDDYWYGLELNRK